VEVRPIADALLVPSSCLRRIVVSASAPHAGVAQSRGVPSATRWVLDQTVTYDIEYRLTRESGHGHTIGTNNFGGDAVCEDVGGSKSHEEDC
jgi:hypothetical protein